MAFVNEYITPEDREKYGLDELDKIYQRMFLPMSKSDDFTIDRERNCYLRLVKLGREPEGEGNIWYFSFFINENTYVLKFLIEEAGNLRTQAYRKYTLLKIQSNDQIDITPFFPILKEALIAYKVLGILSKCTSFEANFDFYKDNNND